MKIVVHELNKMVPKSNWSKFVQLPIVHKLIKIIPESNDQNLCNTGNESTHQFSVKNLTRWIDCDEAVFIMDCGCIETGITMKKTLYVIRIQDLLFECVDRRARNGTK